MEATKQSLCHDAKAGKAGTPGKSQGPRRYNVGPIIYPSVVLRTASVKYLNINIAMKDKKFYDDVLARSFKKLITST